jgi:thioredoxin-like negative regulator of GroEL
MTGKGSAAAQHVGPAAVADRPRLVFFYSQRSGRCRRVEGFLAQVLQRRHNHATFDLVRVSVERRPDLAERFRVTEIPTLLLIQERRVQKRIVDPKGCRDIERELSGWLQ